MKWAKGNQVLSVAAKNCFPAAEHVFKLRNTNVVKLLFNSLKFWLLSLGGRVLIIFKRRNVEVEFWAERQGSKPFWSHTFSRLNFKDQCSSNQLAIIPARGKTRVTFFSLRSLSVQLLFTIQSMFTLKHRKLILGARVNSSSKDYRETEKEFAIGTRISLTTRSWKW